MDVKRKYKIEKLNSPICGYKYNAQVFTSTDGGASFYYCGIGKYTKTEQEAEEFCKQYEAEHAEN